MRRINNRLLEIEELVGGEKKNRNVHAAAISGTEEKKNMEKCRSGLDYTIEGKMRSRVCFWVCVLIDHCLDVV